MDSKEQSEDLRSSRPKSPWLMVAGATVALCVSVGPVVQYSFALFVKPLADSFESDRSVVSLALTLAIVLIGLAMPLVGALIDRVGLRIVTLSSILLTAGGLVLVGALPTDVSGFIALYCVAGIAATGFSPLPYAKAIAAFFTHHRGLALGISMTGVGLGTMLVPQLARVLIEHYTWRGAYLGLAALVLFVAFPATYFTLRNLSLSSSPKRNTAELGGLTILETLVHGNFWKLAASFFFVALASVGVMSHIAAMLTDHGVSPEQSATAISVGGLALIAGRLLSGYLLDRVFAPYVALGFFVLPLVGVVLLIVADGAALSFVAAALVGLGLGAEFDLIAYMISRYVGQRAFGSVYGYLLMAFMFGAGLGPYLMGLSYSVEGSYETALIVFVPLLAIACALLMTLGAYRYALDGTEALKTE